MNSEKHAVIRNHVIQPVASAAKKWWRHTTEFSGLANTPPADPFVDEGVAGRAVAFLRAFWAFQNGIAHVCSYSQTLP